MPDALRTRLRSKAMRIALVTRRFDPAGGGTERDLMVTAQCLRDAGHAITIYTDEMRGEAGEWRVKRVGEPLLGRVLTVMPSSRALGLMRFGLTAARRARNDGADLVLSFARIADADVLRSGGSAHASYVHAARQWRSAMGGIAMRLSPYHRAQMALERRGYTSLRLKKAIAVSELVRRDLIKEFAIDSAKVVTLYNGVDLDRFRPPTSDEQRQAVRNELAIPAEAPAVIFVGNGFARKGLGYLIRAWPAVGTESYLVVAGADRTRASYERLAQRLGVGGRVRFVGTYGAIERLFEGVDALALPSLFEPFGNVVMEAMAAGLPVMTSAACGVTELVPEEMHAFVVEDATNGNEIASRMRSLIEARRGFAEVARAAAEKWTWERYGKELLGILATV
jgi:UDP-glucose:(heptosyl)LPS alpha-1,3-glucosyltransferase